LFIANALESGAGRRGLAVVIHLRKGVLLIMDVRLDHYGITINGKKGVYLERCDSLLPAAGEGVVGEEACEDQGGWF